MRARERDLENFSVNPVLLQRGTECLDSEGTYLGSCKVPGQGWILRLLCLQAGPVVRWEASERDLELRKELSRERRGLLTPQGPCLQQPAFLMF